MAKCCTVLILGKIADGGAPMADKGQNKRQEKKNKPKLSTKEKKEKKDRKRAAKQDKK